MTVKAILAAAEVLNRANVRAAQASGERLYREAMTTEARALDEAFQAHYEAQQPQTDGPQPLPRLHQSVEIDAKAIGFTLKMSEETKREIEEIERNSAMARLNAPKMIFD